ncbi:ArsR/SmtB family transcription factor [Angustibacter sp. McL0619]|uniref:ArsR/SmtB family transcription factor n=1 Tax=Angustibacter sp. McL0619 TaxID=3415676 RepID=UPI003CFA4D72
MPNELRALTGARTMRALAHPLRIKLLELVTLRGPLTASQCAPLVGESPSSCSFHLRQLAKYGYLEEAPTGVGRNRPWQATAVGHHWEPDENSTVAARAASEALAEQFRERSEELYREYLAAADRFEPAWSTSAMDASANLYLTPAELAQMSDDLMTLWQKYLDRVAAPSRRPDGARLVHLRAQGFPRADDLEAEAPTSPETTPNKENDDA